MCSVFIRLHTTPAFWRQTNGRTEMVKQYHTVRDSTCWCTITKKICSKFVFFLLQNH